MMHCSTRCKVVGIRPTSLTHSQQLSDWQSGTRNQQRESLLFPVDSWSLFVFTSKEPWIQGGEDCDGRGAELPLSEAFLLLLHHFGFHLQPFSLQNIRQLKCVLIFESISNTALQVPLSSCSTDRNTEEHQR